MTVLLSLAGSICYVPVSIAVDPDRSDSVVSSVFAGRHALPETVTVSNLVARRVTSGPVVVPTTTGRFTCSFPLHVGHTVDADVVLGRDWLNACSLSTVGPYVDDPSSAAQAALPSRFGWAPHSIDPVNPDANSLWRVSDSGARVRQFNGKLLRLTLVAIYNAAAEDWNTELANAHGHTMLSFTPVRPIDYYHICLMLHIHNDATRRSM